MKEEEKNAIDITAEETKQHSEFLEKVLDFGNYQKKEINGKDSKKGFLFIAVDGDAAEGDAAYSTAVIGGNREYLNGVIKHYLVDDSCISYILRRAMTEVAMKHVMEDIIGKMSNDDK